MAADVSLPQNLEYNHQTFVKIGLALAYSTPFYRTLTIREAISDLYSRTRSNLASPATISQVLGKDFQRTEQQIPLFQKLGEQKAGLVAMVLESHFQTLPPEEMKDMLMVPAIILPIFAVLAVILRFFTRYFITKVVRLEDWLILLGLAFAIVISISIGISEGFGMHIWDVPLNSLLRTWRTAIIQQNFVTLCHFFIKSSLLAFYYRLSPKNSFRIAIWITVAANTAHTISNLFATLLSCQPIVWSDALFTARCSVNRYALNFSGVVIFMLLDVVIVLLPIPYILRLQLKKREKVLTIGLFSLGALVVFASGMKVARLHDLAYNVDTTWQIDNLQWTLVELNLGIICACAPSLRHLTCRSRLKLFYQERIAPFCPFLKFASRKAPNDRKSSGGAGEAVASSFALETLSSNATYASNLGVIPSTADIGVSNPHHHRNTCMIGIRSSSLPTIDGTGKNRTSLHQPSPTSKARPNLKILTKEDIDLIEQGYPGLGIDLSNYSEDEDIERESIYTHDLTRASSRALPEDLESLGFSIVPKEATAFRASIVA